MTIDFGKVERYIEDRGFGFVSHTFANMPPKEVFFHIKVVKRTHPESAQALDGTTTSEQVYFWYEYTITSKGQEVLAILDSKQIWHKYADHKAAFIDTIKTSWMNVEKPLPESLRRATSDLLTADEVDQLTASRGTLEAEHRRNQEELQKAEAARQQAVAEQRAAQRREEAARQQAVVDRRTTQIREEAARQQAVVDQRATQKREEDDEFRQLVAEVSALGFTKSADVSKYIKHHRIGYKYKHISGILQMEMDGNEWSFDGGFPRHIFARLCDVLELQDQGSRAIPGAFTPYKDILPEHP